MSASDRKQFVSSLRFERRPWVKRAIFVATPHRGSRLANVGIVRWATTFVPYPHSCVEKPETVEEIVRLLKLHLKTARRGGK